MSAIQKLAELSEHPTVKEQVGALEARDSSRVKELKSANAGDGDLHAQLTAVCELLPLLTLNSMKGDGPRKALIESSRASTTSALNKVAYIAQRRRNAALKQWCEQVNVVFSELSGTPYTPSIQRPLTPPILNSPALPPKDSAPAVGSISQDGKKWTVRGYIKQTDPVCIDASDLDLHGSVNICDCVDTVFKVRPAGGKLTAVAVDGCRGVGVIIEGDVIASLDLVNSKRCQVQIAPGHHLPTAAVESCDGVTLYLSVKCRDVSIVTSRSAEINIVHPAGGWPVRPTRTIKRIIKKTVKVKRPKVKEARDVAMADDSEHQDEEMREGEEEREGEDGGEEAIEEEEMEDMEEEEMEEVDEEQEEEIEEVEQGEFDETSGETVEVAIPVQFRSYFDPPTGRLITQPVQHTGGN